MKEENCISTTMMGEKAYKLKHIAKLLNLNIETIRRYVRTGKIESYKFSKEYFITESQLNKFLEKSKKEELNMKTTREIEITKDMVENFKTIGIDSEFNEETGEIGMDKTNLEKFKVLMDSIQPIKK